VTNGVLQKKNGQSLASIVPLVRGGNSADRESGEPRGPKGPTQEGEKAGQKQQLEGKMGRDFELTTCVNETSADSQSSAGTTKDGSSQRWTHLMDVELFGKPTSGCGKIARSGSRRVSAKEYGEQLESEPQ